jgi:uncharacterized protein (DUF305 family)
MKSTTLLFLCLAVFAIFGARAQQQTVTFVATVPTGTNGGAVGTQGTNAATQATVGTQGTNVATQDTNAATQATAGTSGTTGGGAAGNENITEQVKGFEVAYLTYILDHHYVGIRASAICLESTKTLHPSLRQLCRYINATARAQFDIVSDLLIFYHNTTHTPSVLNATLTSNGSSSAAFWKDQLFALQNTTSDAEFEQKFLRFLVVYQGSSIIASVPCAQSSFHKELIDFCISEILSQTAQMGQVRAMLCSWYNVCQIELTPEEIKAQQDAYNFVTLGLGGAAAPAPQPTAPATEINTSTVIATATATEIATQVVGTEVVGTVTV